MQVKEKLLNVCFGLNLIYWGIAGFFYHYEDFQTSYVRLFITFLNISVGLLIIFRKPVKNSGTLHSILISLPSLISGGLLFKLSKPLFLWNHISQTLFIVGGSITLISFFFLGRSFSIFPRLRGIVSKGLYQIVRHPAYLGEFTMLTACLIAANSYLSWIPFLIFIPGIVLRIREEESILVADQAYVKYQQKVQWRLIPYIW